jgi:hypothetical protein
MNGRTASILLAGVLFSSGSSAQTPSMRRLISAKNEETRHGPKASEDLSQVARTIGRVERAFEAGDSDQIEPCLSEKRIYLSLKARGEEAGYYGRSQVKHMLGRLFRERRTDSFTYRPEDIELSRDDSAAFRAEWSYVPAETDDIVTEELRFKLDRARSPDGDDWLVSEIRAQSR